MKNNRHKYFYISNSITTTIALILFYVAFFLGDAENYVFPRIIISGMAVLALLLWFEKNSMHKTTQNTHLKALLPGLGVSIVYILLINFIGFYASSIVAFFTVIMIYQDKQKTTGFWHTLLVKLGISATFTFVLYVLFTKILHVRMPEGMFF